MARTTTIFTISLPPEMAEKVEELRKKEKRTRSELFREALRRYFEEQELKELMKYGRMKAREKGLSVDQVEDIVDAGREDAVKALHQIMSEVQGQNKDVDPDIIEREVAEAVREVRRRKQKRNAKGRS